MRSAVGFTPSGDVNAWVLTGEDLDAWAVTLNGVPGLQVEVDGDTGRVRSHNEDSCATFESRAGARLLVVRG